MELSPEEWGRGNVSKAILWLLQKEKNARAFLGNSFDYFL